MMVTELQRCRGCWKHLYPRREWAAMSPEQRRRSGGTESSSADLCYSCHRADPSSWEPEPGAPYHLDDCDTCGAILVPETQWKRESVEERAIMRAEGMAAGSNGRCRRCRARLRERERRLAAA